MKRKLLCIIFILAGAVVTAGIILLSNRRSEYSDPSPVYALIFLSILTIASAAWSISKELNKFAWVFRSVSAVLAAFAILAFIGMNLIYILLFLFVMAIAVAAWQIQDEPNGLHVSRLGMFLLWAFRIVSVLTILAGFAFIIMWILTGKYDFGLQNVHPLMVMAVSGIVMAAVSLKLRAPVSGRGTAKAARCIPIAAALAITFALGSIYLNYMPKYSLEDGLNILLSDREFAQKDLMGSHDVTIRDFGYTESFGGNPYFQELFTYPCDSYGYDAGGLHIVKGYILFNPATGEYLFTRTEDQDHTYSPGDWPEFNYNLVYDNNRQHNTVLSLYFRDWWIDLRRLEASDMNRTFSVSSSEWDAKLEDVMYPNNFPEDEARAFLRNRGEEALKTKLLEQINGLGTKFKDMSIDIFFFGFEIGTYQNGEILLKL